MTQEDAERAAKEFSIVATSETDEPVHEVVSKTHDALAIATRWVGRGFKDITITFKGECYTPQQFSAKFAAD